MDKGKFQGELVKRLGRVIVVHITFNCCEKEMISGSFNGSSILDYDILFVEKQVGNETIQMQVKFQDLDHPFVTIEVLGKYIGVGYYAEEDPEAMVWACRISSDQKDKLAALGVEIALKNIIEQINATYLICK